MSSGTPMVRAADIRHDWYIVDASDQVLGRLASAVARVLSGKHRPNWVAHLDTGDFVVVTNAERVKLTGRKAEEKVYHRHTGYPGGLKTVAAPEVRAKYPERLIEAAVRGMLPKTKLGRRQLKKLKVYRGASHPHEAQRPKPLERPRQARAKQ
ncbi:MAG TPA: 50S ribosomal protein L13 [Thermoanaerobaculia bacterium]|nr:50S ribosomal protein L13 [Thermoanaerobaculia bacterium]